MSITLIPNSAIELPPTLNGNATIQLGYNANGNLVQIIKTIDGTDFTRTITNDDTVVDTTKIISAWS